MTLSKDAPKTSTPDIGRVAFDFDGTLTVRDSFRAFLIWLKGQSAYQKGIRGIAPDLVRYLVRQDRGQLKAALLLRMLGPVHREALGQAAQDYCAAQFDQLVRAETPATVRAHLDRGDPCVIVTASPALLVAPFGARLGVERVIGTELSFDEQGRFTGHILGLNCRGAEKVRRLRQDFGPDMRLVAAYGDTAGDREMLAIADQPFYRTLRSGPISAV